MAPHVSDKSRRHCSVHDLPRDDVPMATFVIANPRPKALRAAEGQSSASQVPIAANKKSGQSPSPQFRIFEVFPSLPSDQEDVLPQDQYVLRAIRNPKVGSDFDLKTRWFRDWLPDRLLLFVICMMGYNGYLMYLGHQIVGHMFYQAKGPFWYSFSLCVRKDHQRKGFSKMLMNVILEHAFHKKKISGIRMGKGIHPVVERIRHQIVMNNVGLSFRVLPVREPGWVVFVRPVRPIRT